MTNLSSVDWDEFDKDSDFYQQIKSHFSIHSRNGGGRPKNWLIPRWIGTRDVTVIFGPSESGKSVFAIDAACRLAAGMDLDGNPLPYARNVLYIAAERADQVDRRIDAFVKHHQGEDFPNLIVYRGPIDLTQPHILRAIVRAAGIDLGDTIDVVFVDTLAASMSASDSNPEAMARAVWNLNEAARFGNYDETGEFGCAVVVVHHSPVSGEQRMRGGGQLQGAADMSILVTRKGAVSTARVAKNNESADRPIRTYRMETVILSGEGDEASTAPVLVPAEADPQRKPKRPSISLQSRRALEVLRSAIAANDNQPVSVEQWRSAVNDSAGDITPAGKRKRFQRDKEIIAEGLAVEIDGLFSVTERDIA